MNKLEYGNTWSWVVVPFISIDPPHLTQAKGGVGVGGWVGQTWEMSQAPQARLRKIFLGWVKFWLNIRYFGCNSVLSVHLGKNIQAKANN